MEKIIEHCLNFKSYFINNIEYSEKEYHEEPLFMHRNEDLKEPLEYTGEKLKLNGYTARYETQNDFQRVIDLSKALETALLLLKIERLEALI